MSERKVMQICAVVKDIQKSMEEYWKILGIGSWNVYTFSPETIREFTLHGQVVKYEHRRDAILLREIANFPNDTKSISLGDFL